MMLLSLRVPLGMFVATASWWNELRHGIHGGDVETSLVLHFRPDLVSMELAQNFVSLSETMENEF
jgi:creatinine amidohydrolase